MVYVALSVFFIAILRDGYSQANKQIEIVNTDSLKYDRERGVDLKLLYGNVVFKHQNTLMYCDSAHFYSDANLFDAFGHVKINQGDSITALGDSLHYDGGKDMARLRGNVTLTDDKTVLTTHFLDYDIKKQMGVYFNGGKIVDSNNTLTSVHGKYLANADEFIFRKDVVLHNEDCDVLSDTLVYNTETNVARLLGPSHVVSEDHYLYTERGWYNTSREEAFLDKKSRYKNKEKRISADTIRYDKKKGEGRAYGRVTIHDTTMRATVKGGYAFYRDMPEYAYVVDSMVMEKELDGDTLYVHGDTLEIKATDSTKKVRVMKVYNHVRFFKNDLQGKCDSMVYKTADSTLYMIKKPVLWSGVQQVTGVTIRIHIKDDEVDRVYIDKAAFLVSQDDDTSNYNQVKGVNMIAYFEGGEFRKLDVVSSGQTIYYMRDGEDLSGVNKADCEDITLFFKENEVDEVLFKKHPSGTMFPLDDFKQGQTTLDGFKWFESIKPRDKHDIFEWKE